MSLCPTSCGHCYLCWIDRNHPGYRAARGLPPLTATEVPAALQQLAALGVTGVELVIDAVRQAAGMAAPPQKFRHIHNGAIIAEGDAADMIGSLRALGVPTDITLKDGRKVTPDPATWPWWVRALATLRAGEDKGVGDTIARNLDRFGADAIKRFYTRLTGKDCGCAERQKMLNLMFPYVPST